MAKYSLGFAVALVLFALDQLSKWFVTGPLGVNHFDAHYYVTSFFQFTYTENNGISLGLFTTSGRWILVALTSAIAVGVAIWIGKEENRTDKIALGMVLGGALGNIFDRALHGYVTDFLDLHVTWIPQALCLSYQDGVCRPFLIFNVGDAAISIGVVILLLRAFLTRKEHSQSSGAEENIEHA